MKEIGITNPEYTYQSLQAQRCLPMHPLKKPSPGTNLPIYLTNSTFIVSTIIYPKLMQIVFTGFLFGCYKGLPSMNNIFTCASLFLFHFHFHRILFRGLVRACVNLGSLSYFVHSLVCPITHSFLDGFQPNLVHHFPKHALPVILFSA